MLSTTATDPFPTVHTTPFILHFAAVAIISANAGTSQDFGRSSPLAQHSWLAKRHERHAGSNDLQAMTYSTLKLGVSPRAPGVAVN